MSVSVVLITKNEEKIIARCLESIRWADEIIVVDSGSADDTVPIAKRFGAKVILKKWEGYAKQKNFGMSKAKSRWILSLDADEIITAELNEEILSAVHGKNGDYDGFYIPRRTYFYGRLLKHGNIYPDYQLRLFRKGAGKYEETEIHERLVLKGEAGRMKNPMLHYSKDSIKAHVEVMNSYTTLEVKRAIKIGYMPTGYSVLIKPMLYFMKHYIFRAGFLDGFAGLVYYTINSMYIFTREIKIMEAVGVGKFNLMKTLLKRAR
jgi:glycosyltransferase involved in cell wall biosynthesis